MTESSLTINKAVSEKDPARITELTNTIRIRTAVLIKIKMRAATARVDAKITINLLHKTPRADGQTTQTITIKASIKGKARDKGIKATINTPISK